MPRGNYTTPDFSERPSRTFTRKPEYIDEIKYLIRMYAFEQLTAQEFGTTIQDNLDQNDVSLDIGVIYHEYRNLYHATRRTFRTTATFTAADGGAFQGTTTTNVSFIKEEKSSKKEPKKTKSPGELNILLAYPAFYESFKARFKGNVIANRSVSPSLRDIDLIVFSGGEDINPGYYNAKNTYSHGINPSRDDTEANVYHLARKLGIKMLGVCRGHQLICALQGGSLYQDLYLELGSGHKGWHPITVVNAGNLVLANIFKDVGVNSLHHQGIKGNWATSYTTALYNGVPEMIETNQIITVQFHPEFMDNQASNLFFNKIEEWASK